MTRRLLLILLLSGLAWGQGALLALSPAQDLAGNAIPNASIRVCTAASTGTPCTPLATIYTDSTLGTIASNPTNYDNIGNPPVIGCVPGIYKVQASSQGFAVTSTVACPLTNPISSLVPLAGQSLAVQFPNVVTGIFGDGSGFKHRRVPGCATAASQGAVCTTVVNWLTSFADTNYTVSCIGEPITSGLPVSGGLTAKAVGSVTFETVSLAAAVAQYGAIDCIAVHD